MNQLQKLKTDFLEHLEVEKNRSPKTIENYSHYLDRFLQWAKLGKPEQITADVVRQYRLFLNRTESQGAPLSGTTQNYHIVALRSFLKYLAKRDFATLSAEKIELPKTDPRQVSFLEPDEVEALFAAAKPTTLTGLRNRALLEVLFSTGLRVSELVALNRAQVNVKKGEFTVRGKGNKLRVVFLSDGAKQWLGQYLEKRSDANEPVFVHHNPSHKANSDNDPRLTPRSVQRIIKQLSLAAGITKEVTPHTLRHSFATDLLTNGADIRAVQSLLGHSSITTTQVYTHVTNRQLKEVHQSFHARRRGKP